MAAKLSGPQLAAVEQRGQNMLVAAGAGSGKTTVLVERVLNRLTGENPLDIDRLLVLTFTNGAAAEMRARIEEGLAEGLRQRPGDSRLERQLALSQQASITTIHSFCLELVRRNFYRLGLDAGFRIPSETERAILREETLAAYMEEQYAKEDDLLAELADCYGGQRDDSALLALVDELYSFSRSQPHPEAWLVEAAEAAKAPSVDDFGWSSFMLAELQREAALALAPLAAAGALADKQELPAAWQRQIGAEQEALAGLLAAKSLKEFLSILPKLAFERLPSAGKERDEGAKEEFKKRRDQGKSILKELQKSFGQRGVAAMEQDMRALAPLLWRLADLVCGYGRALDAEKRRRNLLDFDDMEHFCLRLLEDEQNGVAAELRLSYEELLIDEYQDINAVQERILKLLSRGDNFFAVGDVKQSIYRFRLAEPTLFLQKYQDFGRGEGGRRIDLNRNYRSSKEVIATVNFLFRQLMTVELAELDYDEAAELKAGREQRGPVSELWLIERAEAEEQTAPELPEEEAAGAEDDPHEPLAPLVAEARLLGRRMLELREEGYAFREMAVLLRATKGREGLLGRELAQMGIPTVAAGSGDYLQTPEIGLMLAILAIIDNPLQERELAAVLRSPLFGFSLDELAALSFAAPAGGLPEGLQILSLGGDELGRRCHEFLRLLESWRESLRFCRVSELIWQIYRQTGLYQLAGALPEGGQRQENLLLLYRRAKEYEAGSYRGLFRFLLFLADGRGKALESGVELAEGEDAVRIMSIHRSKGLEFPVVFVANLQGAFFQQEQRRELTWHKELGLAAKVVERKTRRRFPSLAQAAISRRLHNEAMAEEMRVLYVALTRARERLILTAGVKDLAKTAAAWYDEVAGQGPKLSGSLLGRDKRPLDWLGKALLRHPEAGALRAAAGIKPGSAAEQSLLLPAEGGLACHIIGMEQLRPLRADDERPQFLWGSGLPAGPAQGEVEAVLSYAYPRREYCDRAAKWTVSELNRLAQQLPEQALEEAEPLFGLKFPSQTAAKTPETVAETAAKTPESAAKTAEKAAKTPETAAKRGIAQHKLLQHLDFARATTREQLKDQLTALLAGGLLTEGEMALIDEEKIIRFACSPLARRFSNAKRQLREAAFSYAPPASALWGPMAPPDKLVLQGMIDAAFWEPEGWVLLDYKTGGFGRTEAQLRQAYGAQLAWYGRALQDIWQQPLKESWLCFIDLEQNIKL